MQKYHLSSSLMSNNSINPEKNSLSIVVKNTTHLLIGLIDKTVHLLLTHWKVFTTPRVTHQTCFCYVKIVAALTESIQGMPPLRPLNWRGSHHSGSCLLKRKTQRCQVTLLKINILQHKQDWQQWQHGNSLWTSDFWSQEIAYLWSVSSKHANSSMNDSFTG